MTEDETQTIRRLALSAWLKENGGARASCRKQGLGKSVESHISQIVRGYSFGARAARNLENKLGIPHFHLEYLPTETVADVSNGQIDKLDALVFLAAQGKDASFDGLSTSEAVYLALASNRIDILKKMGYTIAEGLARIGANWIAELMMRWQNSGDPQKFKIPS